MLFDTSVYSKKIVGVCRGSGKITSSVVLHKAIWDIDGTGVTEVDAGDYGRIKDYVRNGGQLYLSGGDCYDLLQEFFHAEIVGRTKGTEYGAVISEKAVLETFYERSVSIEKKTEGRIHYSD